jgi:hypothetical protein
MDYTTTAYVKASLGGTLTGSDTLLARYVTAASRSIDRHCSGQVYTDDYFLQASVANELITGHVDINGSIVCQPRKAKVTAVSAFSYRSSPLYDWTTFDVNDITLDGYTVTAWAGLATRGKLFVKISYTGGLATVVTSLPGDLVEAATILAIRMYEEAKSGMGDVIGVSEMGQVFYSKAMPQRVALLLQPYRRVI